VNKPMKSTSAGEQQKLEDAARAGWLYYVAGKSQDEIARQMRISRQSAQRLVALSVSAGLIKMRLEHPLAACMTLAAQLQETFGLSTCEVVPSAENSSTSTAGLAQAGAAEMERYLKGAEPQVVAYGTGRVLRACADELSVMDCPQHKIVSLVGNIADDGSASRYDVAACGRKNWCCALPYAAAGYCGSAAEKINWHNLPNVAKVQTLAAQADVVFVGIGQLGTQSPLHDDGFIIESELAALETQGAAGEIISWIYNQDGIILDCCVNTRVTSTPLSTFEYKPTIGIAAVEGKVAAIRGALRAGLINGLITNEYTARRLLT